MKLITCCCFFCLFVCFVNQEKEGLQKKITQNEIWQKLRRLQHVEMIVNASTH